MEKVNIEPVLSAQADDAVLSPKSTLTEIDLEPTMSVQSDDAYTSFMVHKSTL